MKRASFLLILTVLIGCTSATPYPTPTAYPTLTPYPTYTPYPTPTPEPTAMPTSTPTQTPTPTTTPTQTPTPTQTAIPTPDLGTALLQAIRTTRQQIEEYGGIIDQAARTGLIHCQPTVELYDAVAGAPNFDVSGSDEITQWAYNSYRQAVNVFSEGAQDMTWSCRDWLANPHDGSVAFQAWGLARQQVNEALNVLIPAIERLETE